MKIFVKISYEFTFFTDWLIQVGRAMPHREGWKYLLTFLQTHNPVFKIDFSKSKETWPEKKDENICSHFYEHVILFLKSTSASRN